MPILQNNCQSFRTIVLSLAELTYGGRGVPRLLLPRPWTPVKAAFYKLKYGQSFDYSLSELDYSELI